MSLWLELLVVVVGIFIAFQVDRWYAERNREANTNERVHALIEDFDYNREELAYVSDRLNSVLDGAHKLLEMDGRDPSAADFEMFYESLADLSWTATPLIRRGGYDVLISTGEIGLVADNLLQQELAEFYVLLDDFFEFHQGTTSVEKTLFVPYVVNHLDHLQMLEYVHPPEKPFGIRQDSAHPTGDRFLDVLGTPVFEGVMSAKWHSARDELLRITDMQSKLSSIEERLEHLSSSAQD